MKTKKLIEWLMKEDPTGEEEVVCGNADISWVSREPAYYDGAARIIIRDENGRAIGGKYKRSGNKIQIHTLGFKDMLWDLQEKAVMDYSELSDYYRGEQEACDKEDVQKSKDLDQELELEYFKKHIKKRADIADEVIEEFFKANISPYDEMPRGNESYVERRNIQWGQTVKIEGNTLKKEIYNG